MQSQLISFTKQQWKFPEMKSLAHCACLLSYTGCSASTGNYLFHYSAGLHMLLQFSTSFTGFGWSYTTDHARFLFPFPTAAWVIGCLSGCFLVNPALRTGQRVHFSLLLLVSKPCWIRRKRINMVKLRTHTCGTPCMYGVTQWSNTVQLSTFV